MKEPSLFVTNSVGKNYSFLWNVFAEKWPTHMIEDFCCHDFFLYTFCSISFMGSLSVFIIYSVSLLSSFFPRDNFAFLREPHCTMNEIGRLFLSFSYIYLLVSALPIDSFKRSAKCFVQAISTRCLTLWVSEITQSQTLYLSPAVGIFVPVGGKNPESRFYFTLSVLIYTTRRFGKLREASLQLIHAALRANSPDIALV